MFKELTKEEARFIKGGEAGSRNGAFAAGRALGVAIGGIFATIYYIGKDTGRW